MGAASSAAPGWDFRLCPAVARQDSLSVGGHPGPARRSCLALVFAIGPARIPCADRAGPSPAYHGREGGGRDMSPLDAGRTLVVHQGAGPQGGCGSRNSSDCCGFCYNFGRMQLKFRHWPRSWHSRQMGRLFGMSIRIRSHARERRRYVVVSRWAASVVAALCVFALSAVVLRSEGDFSTTVDQSTHSSGALRAEATPAHTPWDDSSGKSPSCERRGSWSLPVLARNPVPPLPAPSAQVSSSQDAVGPVGLCGPSRPEVSSVDLHRLRVQRL